MKLLKLSFLILLLLIPSLSYSQDLLASGDINEGSDEVDFNVPRGTISFNIEVTGTFVGTLEVLTSSRENTTPANVQLIYNSATGALVDSITAPGSFALTNTGFVRLAVAPDNATWTSGTAAIRINRGYGPIPSAGSGGGGGVGGDVGSSTDAAATPGGTGTLTSQARLAGAQRDTAQGTFADMLAALNTLVTEFQTDEALITCELTSIVFGKNTTGATEIIPISGTDVPHICAYSIDSEGTTDFQFVRGTGTNCGTGQAAISKNHAFSTTTGYLGETHGTGIGAVVSGTSGNAICVLQSAAIQTNFTVKYTYVAP